MLSVPPYNTWPLRVKIYSKEVSRLWEKLTGDSSSLPKGVEVFHEMEGVDGKSGLVGSGRTGPIDVTDTHKFLQASEHPSSPHPIRHPHRSRSSSPHRIHMNNMIPRGGACPSCGEWTLWGDLIRGCYRRKTGAVNAVAREAQELSDKESVAAEENTDEEGTEDLEAAMNNLNLANEHPGGTSAMTIGNASSSMNKTSAVTKRPRGRPPKSPQPVKTASVPKKRGRPQKIASAVTGARHVHTASRQVWESSDEQDTSLEMIDIGGIEGSD
ncbi:Slx4p interacting protein [Tulasnella sp. UAMH 9824]|nr:Slx4p interacting protein [Tulasnella sp. UAMH 9824]